MTSETKSELNPLAHTFFPKCCDTTQKSNLNSVENEAKTTRKRTRKQSSNDWDSKHDDLTLVTVKQLPIKNWTEYLLLGGITTILNFVLQNPFIRKTLPTFKRWQPPVLQECPSQDLVQLQKRDANLKETIKTVVKETIECNCPPMFGWSVPPDFTGNPFNFKYECRKKYPHSPDSKKMKSDKNLDPDTEINELTLDECVSVLKDIIIDVYETIAIDSNPRIKCDEYYKTDNLKVSYNKSDDEEDNKSRTLKLPFTSEITTELELIDDGIHPLLQSAPAKEEENKDILIKVEKILERILSHSLNEDFEAETICSVAVCDPPCSVWCESLPSAAKDTFTKYIQKRGNCKGSKQLRSFGPRPAFKRSLSADDAPMHVLLNKGSKQTSTPESRDMLIWLRKDPLSYFKNRSDWTRKSISYDSFDQHLLNNSIAGSSMWWGKFASADSLWKPLPECVPMNGYPKPNIKRLTSASFWRS